MSAQDVERYRHILALQNSGKWTEADSDIAALDDKLLLGTVEAQRYLSPTYKTSYNELRDWLATYGDAPDAPSLYSMATKRRPKGAAPPATPVVEAGLRTRDAGAMDDRPAKAFREARLGDAAERGGDSEISTSHLSAGLAAWRAGKLSDALTHFETLAKSPGQSPWIQAAAAFWAARVELRSHRPEMFNYWLGLAAEHPKTFYGLLARRTLGVDTYFDFENDSFGELDGQILTGMPGGRRALGLIQIGETARAEAELRALASHASPNVLQSLSALADRANMPALSLELAAQVGGNSTARNRNVALFPVPQWSPVGGFTVDRALIYALMRQESQFIPVARNPSGAMGLMQLMPATARALASSTGLRARNLAEPSVNLALAQQYVLNLIDDPHIRGNLLYLAVAYNTGPGGIPRLIAGSGNSKDPLIFIESIASRETRTFIHHVLTNYWIYRQRLGQHTPDLDALAAGEWPTYTALDQHFETVVRHAENR